ncbi:hypothetical protein Tco_1353558, partial [Tanacetum coccineum]
WKSQAPRLYGGTPAQTRSERVLAQPNEPPLSEGYTSGSGEGRMEHTFELTDNVPSTPHNSSLTGGYTPRSDEGRMTIDELITLFKKLERKRKSSISHPRRRKYQQVETSSDDDLDKEDASKQGRRSDKLKPMFKDKDLKNLMIILKFLKRRQLMTPPITTTIFDDEDVTMAMKEQKAKEKGVAITDVEDSSRIARPVRSITTLQPLPIIDPKDKDVELAQRLHEEELAELERAQQERQRQEDDTNAALAKELYEKEKRWIDDFQPMDTKAIKDSEKKVDSSSKQARGKEQESAKSNEKAAADYEHEKEELRMWLTVVLDEEEIVDVKILSAKYPIVDWESQNLGNVDMEDLHVYKIIRADRNTSYHKSLSSMLRKFDRQDLVDFHKLVMKSFEDTTPEGYNLLLWGDLKKRYPLIKEMLQKMLNWKLEADAESTMAFELLKFIKSQLKE